MGIEEIERALPNGLHDAVMRKHVVDYAARMLTFDVEVWVGDLDAEKEEGRERYEPGMLTFEGLEYFVVEAPAESDCVMEPFSFSAGNPATEKIQPSVSLPASPEGAFRVYFFLHQLNAFMHICARRVRFEYRT